MFMNDISLLATGFITCYMHSWFFFSHKEWLLNLQVIYDIFLERIMCEALDDHEGSVSIGGRLITNFLFADDIVVNAEEEEEG